MNPKSKDNHQLNFLKGKTIFGKKKKRKVVLIQTMTTVGLVPLVLKFAYLSTDILLIPAVSKMIMKNKTFPNNPIEN